MQIFQETKGTEKLFTVLNLGDGIGEVDEQNG
jgi:hypothetical protein